MRWFLPLPIFAVVLAGCSPGSDHSEFDYFNGARTPDDLSYGRVPIERAWMDGVLDQMTVTADTPTRVEAWQHTYRGWTSIYVTVISEPPGGAAMSLISISGSLDHPDLQPGARHSVDQYGQSANTELWISVLGCTGPMAYDWYFDEYAESLLVEVDEDPGTHERVLTVTASYSTGETLAASLVLPQP